jgi:hypothetical protein
MLQDFDLMENDFISADNSDVQTLHNSSGTARSSSSETSSSFDFFPPPGQYYSDHSPPVPPNCTAADSLTNHQRRCVACFGGATRLPDTCRPPPPIELSAGTEIRSPGQDRRGKYGNSRGTGRNRGFFHKGRPQWRGGPPGGPPDYSSDRGRRPTSHEKIRPQSTTGINSEVSSPDLGVDLGCSDPFSSLERSNGMMSAERVRGETNNIYL